MEYDVMQNHNSKDIPTFYTEIAEVSLTGGILVIRILDERPDEEAIERHIRVMSAKLKGSKFPVIVDIRYVDEPESAILNELLRFERAGKRKVVILARSSVCAGNFAPARVFESEQEAVTLLRNTIL